MCFSLVENLVSVVIPAFNCASFIGETIDSCLSQTHQEVEVLVIDDGSTDNTLDVLKVFGDKVQIVSQQNKGISVARNLGILLTKGEYVAFLDADDKWTSDKLKLDLARMNEGLYDYVVSPGILWDGGKLLLPLTEVSKIQKFDSLLDFCINNPGYDPFFASSLVIRRLALSKTGLYNPEIREQGEAYDFHLRVLQYLRGVYRSEPSFFYRQHPGSVSRKPKTNHYINNRRVVSEMLERNKLCLWKKIKIRIKLEVSFVKSFIKDSYLNKLR